MPLPATCSNGSRFAITTLATPAAISACVHGGVLPKWQQGSKLTYTVAPAGSAIWPSDFNLRVAAAELLMPTPSQFFSLTDDHATDQRIGLDHALARRRKLHRQPHPIAIRRRVV